ADALRTEGRYSALNLSGKASEPSMPSPAMEVAADAFELPELQLESGAIDSTGANLPVDAVLEPAMEFDIVFDTGSATAVPAATPAEPMAVPALDIEIEGIDFDSLSALSADGRASPVFAEPPAADKPQSLPADLVSAETLELSAADFDKHFQIEAAALPEAAGSVESAQPQLEDAEVILDIAALDDAPDSVLPADSNGDEQIKVIGTLRIGIPLYNVYLNEADEWSRRLVTEVAEWAIERHQPVSDSTVALAHSLAGSSATVGFDALSEMARALEQALQQSLTHHSNGAAKYGQVFVDAAEDIRRLLHQFAAGFLKEPDAEVLDRLKQLDFSDSVLLPANEFAELEFSAEPLQVDDASAEPAPLPGPEPEMAEAQVVDMPAPPPAAPVPAPAAVVAPPVRLVSPPPVAFRADAAATFGEEGDEDIDAVDAIDPDLFPIFEEEGAELMPQLGGALRQWSARPDNQGARMEVLRALHTLKGSARLAGALRLGEMAHRIESEIEYFGSEAAATQEFEPLLTRFDAMQAAFEGLRHADAAAAAAPAAPLAAVEPLAKPTAVSLLSPAFGVQEPAADGTAAGNAGARKLAIPAPQAMVMQPLRQAASASIRVRSQLLDRMVNQAGEVMITRSRLEAELGQLRDSLNDMSGNLNRLRQQLRDIELQAETQMQSRLAQAKEAQAGFDPLEFDRFTRVQELTRMMAESVNDVATVQRTLQRTVEATEDDLIAQGRQTRELQRDLLRTRMVEFEGISERLYRVVRQASKETGKQVRLDLLGGTIEMDRGMLDRMTPAFEHLLRNCVAHGIESPQGRADAGKDPVGLIAVHLRHEGNDVSVDFSDDGAGLDLRRIREKALSLGLVTADQSLDDQEAANLIFMPGFTTATQVTELAGRGIGMDVVRS
ncbi:MAG: Hpt domain-containing protein, partial [Polaromonas sp.]